MTAYVCLWLYACMCQGLKCNAKTNRMRDTEKRFVFAIFTNIESYSLSSMNTLSVGNKEGGRGKPDGRWERTWERISHRRRLD